MRAFSIIPLFILVATLLSCKSHKIECNTASYRVVKDSSSDIWQVPVYKIDAKLIENYTCGNDVNRFLEKTPFGYYRFDPILVNQINGKYSSADDAVLVDSNGKPKMLNDHYKIAMFPKQQLVMYENCNIEYYMIFGLQGLWTDLGDETFIILDSRSAKGNQIIFKLQSSAKYLGENHGKERLIAIARDNLRFGEKYLLCR